MNFVEKKKSSALFFSQHHLSLSLSLSICILKIMITQPKCVSYHVICGKFSNLYKKQHQSMEGILTLPVNGRNSHTVSHELWENLPVVKIGTKSNEVNACLRSRTSGKGDSVTADVKCTIIHDSQ